VKRKVCIDQEGPVEEMCQMSNEIHIYEKRRIYMTTREKRFYVLIYEMRSVEEMCQIRNIGMKMCDTMRRSV